LSAPDPTVAQTPRVPDTFTATTTGMTPAGVALKIQVKEWSADDARAAAVTALSGEVSGPKSLADLPTIGYVWTNGSPVGYSLKYAHRTPTSGGGERITVVTDRPVGAYDNKPWVATHSTAANARAYSVIELYVDGQGNGVGTMSLAANVVFDQDAQTVSLSREDATPNVLTGAAREPKPYWAQGG
jgi:hypothetical protein